PRTWLIRGAPPAPGPPVPPAPPPPGADLTTFRRPLSPGPTTCHRRRPFVQPPAGKPGWGRTPMGREERLGRQLQMRRTYLGQPCCSAMACPAGGRGGEAPPAGGGPGRGGGGGGLGGKGGGRGAAGRKVCGRGGRGWLPGEGVEGAAAGGCGGERLGEAAAGVGRRDHLIHHAELDRRVDPAGHAELLLDEVGAHRRALPGQRGG